MWQIRNLKTCKKQVCVEQQPYFKKLSFRGLNSLLCARICYEESVRRHDWMLTVLFHSVLSVWTYAEDPWAKYCAFTANVLQEAIAAAPGAYAVVVWSWGTKIPWSLCWNCHCQCWTLSPVSMLLFDLWYKIQEDTPMFVLCFSYLQYCEPKTRI